MLRNYLVINSYGTLVDLEDEENEDLTVNITLINLTHHPDATETDVNKDLYKFKLIEVDERYMKKDLARRVEFINFYDL